MQWYAKISGTGPTSLDGTFPSTDKHNAMGKLGYSCVLMMVLFDRPNGDAWGVSAQKVLDDQVENQNNPSDDTYFLETPAGTWEAYAVSEDE